MDLDNKNNIKDFVIPRSLWLEESKKESNEICIIVGINPGKLSEKENEIYSLNNGKSLFEKYEEFYVGLPNTKEKDHPYYHRLKRLAEKLGYENILWSNLCKCQNNQKELPPVQTFKICINNFLKAEMKLFPNAPIIAAGTKSFEIVSYMFPDRFVIWVPHPTGQYPFFSHLFDKSKKKELRKEYKDLVRYNQFNKKNGFHNSIQFNPLKSYFLTKKIFNEIIKPNNKANNKEKIKIYRGHKEKAKINEKIEGYYFKILDGNISKLDKLIQKNHNDAGKEIIDIEIELISKKEKKTIIQETAYKYNIDN